jgi:hypothetical protein
LHKLLILINHNKILNEVKSSKIRLLAYTFIRNKETINTKIHKPIILNWRMFFAKKLFKFNLKIHRPLIFE